MHADHSALQHEQLLRDDVQWQAARLLLAILPASHCSPEVLLSATPQHRLQTADRSIHSVYIRAWYGSATVEDQIEEYRLTTWPECCEPVAKGTYIGIQAYAPWPPIWLAECSGATPSAQASLQR